MNTLGNERVPFIFLTDFELQRIIITPLSDLGDDILYDFSGVAKTIASKEILLDIDPYPLADYTAAFQNIMDEINYGNTFLINLTARHKVESDASLLDIYNATTAKYKLHIKDRMVVFSPETFIKINDGIISSYPMKGTIDASLPNAAEILLNDEKEKAEHNTIIDLIRNDLSIHAKKVSVTKYRYLDLINSNKKNLYQLSSEISGTLPLDYHSHLGTIIFSLLPAGSISGAPKKKTIDIITENEDGPRGYYTGVCGVFDGTNVDSCVMIRYIEKDSGHFYYRSGGGITFQSDLYKEYQEMIDKIYIPINQSIDD